ncbi:MAG: uroporphyrinogen-III synthase [Hydrogenophaga sp.]|nr:uroporphyrinogen-III synthase [Hydrogenophaga sp.]
MRCAVPAPSPRPRELETLSGPADPLLRLIVTRPAAEAVGWVDALKALGWPTQALPLIHIAEPRDSGSAMGLHHARAHWAEMDALMFVSGAAVSHFFADGVAPVPPQGSSTRFWAPGPGTARLLAQALSRLGVAADRVDSPPADAEQFDSESLWPVVAPQVQSGRRIGVVRGASVSAATATASRAATGTGRDWLIRQCEAAGAEVLACVAYERHPPLWTEASRALARQGQASGSVWLFSSSEALDHLQAGEPQSDWSQAAALATHPRIASRAQAAGFGRVVQSRPALADVVRALESGWIRP